MPDKQNQGKKDAVKNPAKDRPDRQARDRQNDPPKGPPKGSPEGKAAETKTYKCTRPILHNNVRYEKSIDLTDKEAEILLGIGAISKN